jgi:hypothetical protein
MDTAESGWPSKADVRNKIVDDAVQCWTLLLCNKLIQSLDALECGSCASHEVMYNY